MLNFRNIVGRILLVQVSTPERLQLQHINLFRNLSKFSKHLVLKKLMTGCMLYSIRYPFQIIHLSIATNLF